MAGRERLLAIDAVPAPVRLTVSARARRLSMRLDVVTGDLRVTVPRGVREADVRDFVRRNAGWAEQRLGALPPARPFVDGAVIPVRGVERTVRHDPAHRGRVAIGGDEIVVGGAPEFLSRRVRDALRTEARRLLAEASRTKAAVLGRPVKAVTVRDTVSRWGSCAHDGRLSYSWRLVLAPDFVLDYVVGHEVAHLVEMNHSARFWRTVDRLTPHTEAGRAWLKRHGPALLRIG